MEIDLVNGVIQTVPMTSSGARDAFETGERIQASTYAFGSVGASSLVQLRDGAAQAAFYPYPVLRFVDATYQAGYRYIDFKDGATGITMRVRTLAEGAGLTLSETKDGSPFATLALPDTAGQWQTVTFDLTDSPTGVSELYIKSGGNVRAELDWFTLAGKPVFVPVTGITGAALTAVAGTDLPLTGAVLPENATHQTIRWQVKTPGDTGASITENIFRAAKEGTAVITARVTDGTAAGTDFTLDFTLTVNASAEQEKAKLEEAVKTGVAELETWRGRVDEYRAIEGALVEFLVNYYGNALKKAETPRKADEILAEAKTELGKLKTRVQIEGTPTISLSGATIAKIGNQEYTGKAITPVISVTAGGKLLTPGEDYTVQYTGNRSIGKASVKVMAKAAAYSGSRTISFQIIPSRTTISRIIPKAGGQATVAWARVSAAQKITRYQLRYRVKGTAPWRYRSVASAVNARILRGLEKGKAYELQIRSWKSVNRTQYFSPWSRVATSKKMI